ncbi:hypothetical protein DA803_00530 [[Mycoplasma] phocae]|uniref:ATP synthase F1 complex delta/epsilon subunit N-terminal domain-containing protein n=1 Tax=[Mycoplasma] phocae TaxID=142651 RepID=A0A2Z5IQ03_9BACT|nr:F0F1 ATP synthase subunit epsilon [[Mycoplasma] phocae]AXE60582.1 hypothetical protein DA803_00530 [[Mycoplasma] phocae]
MTNNKIRVIITTPHGIFLDVNTDICTFRTTEGEVGLMANATQFISSLIPSMIYINYKSSPNLKTYYVDKGIVYFKDNTLSMIVNEIDSKPLVHNETFVQEDQTKYRLIEELYLKKKLTENNK